MWAFHVRCHDGKEQERVKYRTLRDPERYWSCCCRKANDDAVKNVFNKFAGDVGEGNGSVVGLFASVALLVDGSGVSCASIISICPWTRAE